ncbi:methyltransferase [Trichlorobacter ammonificans]|uniref:Helix-turn-helix SAM-dependent methyltransferase n=1 Tax=Trichlorobacter ammonificans TaxID=2916410 RepID=A0ABM9DAC1_9BACT|nr:methyltransferase [Trichlorobacter ammonificans]CAH2031730.1 Helix-turn-helix SAM-dependent methyltransferase [Trichlorobacter ammonificans]
MTPDLHTPADLLQLSGSYWATCALHAGVALDLFTPLAGQPGTAAELAERQHLEPRALAMLLDALTALGLLTKQADRYEAQPAASRFLSRSSAEYLGHIIMHHHHLMAGWSRLDEAVRNGGPLRDPVINACDDSVRESFLMGMFNLASLLAPRIAAGIDLTGRKRLLDLGGGPGTYAVAFCRQYPGLTATVYDLPSTRPFAERVIGAAALSDRVAFHDGDYHQSDIPGGFDVAWLSHVLHADGPEHCARMLAKAVAALEPGGLLLVQEFILDDSKDGPLFPALFSLNMLLGTSRGQSYSGAELTELMTAAGLRDVGRLPLELPNGAGIMAGTV